MTKISEATKNRYNKRLAEFGYNPKTLGWMKGRQGIRFSALTQIDNLNNSRILDVGCGFGDLYGFLKFKKLNFKYLGLDINPNLIQIGKKKYPKVKFRIFDIEKNKIPKNYDWAIISGLFNFKREDNYGFIEKCLKKIFLACNKGLAVDFMSSYVDSRTKNLSYTSPEKIMKISKNISKRLTIRHDFMPYEFCLYMYKDQKITNDNVFNSYKSSIPEKIRTDKWLQ